MTDLPMINHNRRGLIACIIIMTSLILAACADYYLGSDDDRSPLPLDLVLRSEWEHTDNAKGQRIRSDSYVNVDGSREHCLYLLYRYDQNGQMIRLDGYRADMDASVESPLGSILHTYDAAGQRIGTEIKGVVNLTEFMPPDESE